MLASQPHEQSGTTCITMNLPYALIVIISSTAWLCVAAEFLFMQGPD
jgi:hypothetical protein